MESSRTEIVLPDGSRVPLPPAPARFVQTRETPIKRIRWTHELAIDMMLQNPHWDQRDLAQYFGYSDPWVSLVIASDAFQAKLAERRDEILNPEVKAGIEERFRALANHSLAKLREKLDNPNASDNLVLRSVELASKALGLGARPNGPIANVQVAIVVPPKAEREVA